MLKGSRLLYFLFFAFFNLSQRSCSPIRDLHLLFLLPFLREYIAIAQFDHRISEKRRERLRNETGFGFGPPYSA
jgi:hypothetical protein